MGGPRVVSHLVCLGRVPDMVDAADLDGTDVVDAIK